MSLKNALLLKSLIACFCCLASIFVKAQDEFLVYSLKGDVSVVAGKNKSLAKNGRMLPATATINVPAGGAITFICKEGGMFSKIEEGSYSLNKYVDSCSKGTVGIFPSFTRYMWAHSIKPKNEKGKIRRRYFPEYNVVNRHHNIWIDPLFDTVNYSGINSDFSIYWKSYSNSKTFMFNLYDPENIDTPLYRISLKKLNIPFKDLVPHVEQGKMYYWGVALPGEETEELCVLEYVSNATYDSVLTSIKNMKPAFEAAGEEAYRTAFMLESVRYFDAAYEYYIKAAALDKSNGLYRLTLVAFKRDYDIK